MNIRRALLAAVCSGLLAVVPATAWGSIEIQSNVDGGGWVQLVTDGSAPPKTVSYAGTQSSWYIDARTASVSGPPGSILTMSTFTLKNNKNVSSTIKLQFSQTDYTFPGVSPPDVVLTTSAVGTFEVPTSGGTSKGFIQTWVDPENALFGQGTPTSGLLGGSFEGIGQGGQLPGVTKIVIGPLVEGNNPNFSMTTMVELTLDPGETINFVTTQNLSNVPEPISLAVWSVLGCVAAAGAAFRRRRPC